METEAIQSLQCVGGHCNRCNQHKPGSPIFIVGTPVHESFGKPPGDFTPDRTPNIRTSCRDCLTDHEIAVYLTPIAVFVLEKFAFPEKPTRGSASRADAAQLNYALTWLRVRMGYEFNIRGFVERALQGMFR